MLISDSELRKLENAMMKDLFLILMNSDIQLKSSTYTQDDIPKMTLKFDDETIVVTIKAERVEKKENE